EYVAKANLTTPARLLLEYTKSYSQFFEELALRVGFDISPQRNFNSLAGHGEPLSRPEGPYGTLNGPQLDPQFLQPLHLPIAACEDSGGYGPRHNRPNRESVLGDLAQCLDEIVDLLLRVVVRQRNAHRASLW